MRRRFSNRIDHSHALVKGPDLVSEFKKAIFDWGEHLFYVRRDKNAHCPLCWDPVSNQPESPRQCIECYGTGHVVRVERHIGRYMSESTPGRLSQSYNQQEPGKLYTTLRSVFLKPAAQPGLDDIIIRVSQWNRAVVRPISVTQILVIKEVEDMRQEQGELAFFKTYSETLSINRDLIQDKIRKEDNVLVID